MPASGAEIVGYSAQYDAAGRLKQVTETPSGDVTTYGYDSAGRLLSEQRVGQRPYSGGYAYNASGNRVSANVIANGVPTQNASYAYDGTGRLTTVNDSVNGPESYAWNADGTMASMPRPGYTALMGYDEEGRLTNISHDIGGSVSPAYQYAYGADGGRRWRKDIANNVWTWFPCGVACGAGGLVEKQSDLTGNSWATSAQYLRGNGLISRATSAGAEYHPPDISGVNGVITNSAGSIASCNVYDKFGATQASQGAAQTPWRYDQSSEEGMVNLGQSHLAPAIATHIKYSGLVRSMNAIKKKNKPKKCPIKPQPTCNEDQVANCTAQVNDDLAICLAGFTIGAIFCGICFLLPFPASIFCAAACVIAFAAAAIIICHESAINGQNNCYAKYCPHGMI